MAIVNKNSISTSALLSLGLCPLLAASGSVVTAMGLGLASLVVIIFSSLLISVVRGFLSPVTRLPVFVLVIGLATTVVDNLVQIYAYPLAKMLGIFLPLIVCNCIIMSRAEIFASKNSPLAAVIDAATYALAFLLVMFCVGLFRELLATGTVFADMELLIPGLESLQITVIPGYRKFLLVSLPPGAFISIGLLIALKNFVSASLLERSSVQNQIIQYTGSKRVRVTGKV